MRITLLFCILLFSNLAMASIWEKRINQAGFQFYSEDLQVRYDAAMHDLRLSKVSDLTIRFFQQRLGLIDAVPLLEDLVNYRKAFQLNDWLFYDLIRQTVENILVEKTEQERRLIIWHLLDEAGYETRITFTNKAIFIYVHTNEMIFDTPMIMDQHKKFINLTSVHSPMLNPGVELELFSGNKFLSGKTFSFKLDKLPQIKSLPENYDLNFNYGNIGIDLALQLDRNVFEIMKHYPLFDEINYIKIPLSNTLSKSLIPQLTSYTKSMDQLEVLQFLASFTRTGFKYKDDLYHFGKSKPMIGDELFHYPYSDCEDRTALFYNLVKEILGMPMIILAYDDHLTVAVACDEALGSPILYKGQSYYICDPTGPHNSIEIGSAPKGYETKSFSIIGK